MKKLTLKEVKEIRKQVIAEITEFYLEDTIKQYPNLKLCEKKFKHKGFLLKPGHVLLDDNTIAVPDSGMWSYHLYICDNNKEWIEIFDKNGDPITIHKALERLCLTIKDAIKEVEKAYDALKNNTPHHTGWKAEEVLHEYGDYVYFIEFSETKLSGLYMLTEKSIQRRFGNEAQTHDKYKYTKFKFVDEHCSYSK